MEQMSQIKSFFLFCSEARIHEKKNKNQAGVLENKGTLGGNEAGRA